ncbi:MAG: hypothetical protein JXB88_11550 [Spirochaetales bacterium]|nr:hypothetical protein [Spirochaetales bacterium]
MREMHYKKKGFSYIPVLVSFFIACLYFLFHFHFMQQFIAWDQVWYANNIKNMLEGSVPYFNPHHIHYESGGKLFHEYMIKHFRQAGFTDVVFNNRLRSLLVSCIGIFFIILYIKEMTGKLMWGILGGVLIGFCHGYLAYSTQVDTPIFPASAFCVMCYLVKKVEDSKQHPLVLAFITGVMCAVSVIFHQYSAMTCVAAVACILLPPALFINNKTGSPFSIFKKKEEALIDKKPYIRYKAAVTVAVTGVSLIVIAYFYTGKTVFNLPFDKPDRSTAIGRYSHTTFQKWLFLYQDEGWWAGGFKEFDPRHSFRGFTNAFLSPVTSYKYQRYSSTTFHYDVTHPMNEKAFVYNQVAFAAFIPLAGIFILFPFLWKRYRRGLFFLLASFGLFSIFTAYWEPLFFEFWLIQCIVSCILLILFLHFISEKISVLLKQYTQIPLYLLTIVFILTFSSHNVLYYVIPYSRYRHMEDIYFNWKRDYYMELFSNSVYRYPDNPYKELYTREPVR